jgi:AraC family transcriptional regulator
MGSRRKSARPARIITEPSGDDLELPPDRNGEDHQPLVAPALSDAEMHASIDRIVSRLPAGQISLLASTRALGWENIYGAITAGRLEEFFDYSAPFHVVAFTLKGTATVEWKHGSRFTRFNAQPGELLITPAGEGNSIRQHQSIEAFVCCLNPILVSTLAAQEWSADSKSIEIVAGFNRDPELWLLGERLAARLRSPIAGSRLFAETLLTQIAIKLLWNYSSLPRQSDANEEKLADPRLRRVIDYLHASFGEEVSLDRLAGVAGLSPNYFLHAFKQTMGRTPHRYLTELRIAKACELLENPHQSIVEISLAVGFSSQSHLTTVFRRFMKTTPAAYREDVLGLRSCEP